MPSGWGYSFWFEAAPKAMRSAIGASAMMDGVIVTVVHGEFRGMGLSGVWKFMDEGAAVVDVRGMFGGGGFEGKGFYYRRL